MIDRSREWYVRCKDSRMPAVPMSREDALRQAQVCDEMWPECAPHEIYSGAPARRNFN